MNAPFLVIEALLPQFDSFREKNALVMSTGLYAGITGPGKPQLERLTLVSQLHDS